MIPGQITATEAVRALKARRIVARAFARPRPILVVTAPKTGSTSLEAALAQAGIPPVKLHTPLRSLARERTAWHAARQPAPLHAHMSAAVAARRARTDAPLRVITLVRDPVARAVSAAFQRIETGREIATSEDDMRRIALRLVAKHATRGGGVRWFDAEFAPWIDAHPLDAPFDREAGHGRLTAPGVEVLILQTEKLDAHSGILSDFTGVPLHLARRNVRAKTGMAAAYDRIRQALRLPPEIADRIYTHPFYAHVYAPADLDAFRRRWTAAP